MRKLGPLPMPQPRVEPEPHPLPQQHLQLELELEPEPELPLLSERILMLPAKSPPKEKRVPATLLTEITEMKKKI